MEAEGKAGRRVEVTAEMRRKDGSLRLRRVMEQAHDHHGNELPMRTISEQFYRVDGTPTDDISEAYTDAELAEMRAAGMSV